VAVRWRLALTGLLVSFLLHWFVLDGMRSSASAPLPGPTIKAELRIQDASLPAALVADSSEFTPNKEGLASLEKVPTSRERSVQISGQAATEPVILNSVQTGVLSDDEGVWRVMSDDELQVMARIRIARALILEQVLMTQPVVLRLQRSPTGVVDVDIASQGDSDPAAQRLREAVVALIGAKPGLLPAALVLPLELEFQP